MFDEKNQAYIDAEHNELPLKTDDDSPVLSYNKLDTLFTDARAEWREQHVRGPADWYWGECRGCHKVPVQLAQHWSGCGGADSLECEACYIESLICFWVQEGV